MQLKLTGGLVYITNTWVVNQPFLPRRLKADILEYLFYYLNDITDLCDYLITEFLEICQLYKRLCLLLIINH